MDRLEGELRKLEEEEKSLENRLTELEEKEVELAKTVSELAQVKKRRPDFLINYMSSKNKGLVAEVKPTSTVMITEERREKTKELIEDISLSHPTKKIEEPKTEEKITEVDRKQLLEAHIKKVLENQELRKMREQEKQEILNSKIPVKELKMNKQQSDASHLFQALMVEGVLTVDEASRLLRTDKDIINTWAKDLESSGIIEVSRPLYGSPKLKLKRLPAQMKKTLIK
ncbi:MAG: hypothetical protein JW778_08175 [Candidatus Altiarchaeota archaeon]|nr:hypothetical protein [Candidatus Altiarchaeota archaeon]